jgi:hypothetical protein
MQGLRQVSIKEEQMRWIKSMFSLQGRQCYMCFWVCIPSIDPRRQVLTSCSERKRSQDKIYPKGYVEMLEQQQAQLVSGLKEMYQRLLKAAAWEGPSLDETSGHPLTHDILASLNLLESKHDDSGEFEVFEDSCDKLQSRMVSEGANLSQRRGSLSSDSDHSHHERPKTASSRTETPLQSKASMFRGSFNFPSASSSPLTQSPIPRSKPFAQQRYRAPSPIRSLPLQEPAFTNDPRLYEAQWGQAFTINNSFSDQEAPFKHAMQQAGECENFASWDANIQMETYQFTPYMMSNSNTFGGQSDCGNLAQLDDFDFSTYVVGGEVMT